MTAEHPVVSAYRKQPRSPLLRGIMFGLPIAAVLWLAIICGVFTLTGGAS